MSYETSLKLSDSRRQHLTEVFRQFALMARVRTEYGIDTPRHAEAVASSLEAGDVSIEQVLAASGDGPALTELFRNAPANPNKDLEFTTSFDLILHPERSLRRNM